MFSALELFNGSDLTASAIASDYRAPGSFGAEGSGAPFILTDVGIGAAVARSGDRAASPRDDRASALRQRTAANLGFDATASR